MNAMELGLKGLLAVLFGGEEESTALSMAFTPHLGEANGEAVEMERRVGEGVGVVVPPPLVMSGGPKEGREANPGGDTDTGFEVGESGLLFTLPCPAAAAAAVAAAVLRISAESGLVMGGRPSSNKSAPLGLAQPGLDTPG